MPKVVVEIAGAKDVVEMTGEKVVVVEVGVWGVVDINGEIGNTTVGVGEPNAGAEGAGDPVFMDEGWEMVMLVWRWKVASGGMGEGDPSTCLAVGAGLTSDGWWWVFTTLVCLPMCMELLESPSCCCCRCCHHWFWFDCCSFCCPAECVLVKESTPEFWFLVKREVSEDLKFCPAIKLSFRLLAPEEEFASRVAPASGLVAGEVLTLACWLFVPVSWLTWQKQPDGTLKAARKAPLAGA